MQTHKQIAKLGGVARWSKISFKKRSEIMAKLSRKGVLAKKKKRLSTTKGVPSL